MAAVYRTAASWMRGLENIEFSNGQVSLDTSSGEIKSLSVHGNNIINQGTFSQKYRSLQDRHIEVYLTELSQACRFGQDRGKINDIANKIFDRLKHNDVAQSVYENKIAQIDDKPIINHNLTKIAIGVMILALFAGCIGTAALLTNFHVISSVIGISQIPTAAAIALVTFSGLTLLSYIAARRIGSKDKDSKIAHLIKDLHLTIRNAFLFSNLNDFTASVVYLIAAIVLIIPMPHHVAVWFVFTAKCFALPTGILYLGSGFQQLYESAVELKNSFKWKNLINLLGSVSVIFMGCLFIVGLQSAGIGIATNWILNFLPFIVIGMTLNVVMKQFKDLKETANKSSDDKRLFLEDNLSLTEDEILALKAEINGFSHEQIIKWIDDQSSFTEKMKKKIFKDVSESDHVIYWNKKRKQLLKLKKGSDIRCEDIVKEIKEEIIREEIKVRMLKKIESFAGKIERDTLREVVHLLRTNEKDGTRVNATYAKIRKESSEKYKAEWAKVALQVSFLGTAALASMKAFYGLSQVVLNSINISINSTSRYRNVPTAFLDRYFNVNEGRQANRALAYA